MSAISKTVLRQTSFLYHLNLTRQTILPFSTSIRYLAESTTTNENSNNPSTEGKSYDSIPVHLGPLAKLVMVLGGLHKRLSDVPDSIPNRVYQKTKDRFRARCVVASLFGTALLAIVAATRGKHARDEGKRFTDDIYNMHRGESRLHEQLETLHKHRKPSERYSPAIDEINK